MSLVTKIAPAIGNGPEAMRSIASAINRTIDIVQPFGTLTATGTTTISETYGTYLGSGSASTALFILPSASAHKDRKYSVLNIGTSSNLCKVDGDGSETINGSITIQTTTQYDGWTFVSDGSNWVVLK